MLAPFDIVLSRFNVVEPDLIYFSSGRFKRVVAERNAQGPPDLAIKVLSPTTRRRDEIVMRKLYERTGVVEYWIGDPDLETVKPIGSSKASRQVDLLPSWNRVDLRVLQQVVENVPVDQPVV